MPEIGDKDKDIFKTVHDRYAAEDKAGKFIRDLDCRDTGTGMVRDACDKAVDHNKDNDKAFDKADGTD